MSAPVSALMQRYVRSVDIDETVLQVEDFFAKHGLDFVRKFVEPN